MRTFSIKDFGAVGDGKTLNTAAIQKAIDTCAASGGGRVAVEDGNYLTGTVILRDNVDLHIEPNGRLVGSPRCEDYPEWEKKHIAHADLLPRGRGAALIFAEECENISITGRGIIDGGGEAFVTPVPPEEYGHRWTVKRIDAPTPPRVAFFTGCRNVLIEDVTMVNQPAGWSYWIHDCDYVAVHRAKVIANVEYPNNDGIHINSSRNVTISDCDIACGDDCIVVRANNSTLAAPKVTEKVTVTNCNLTSYASGIRVGWRNDGTIRNCVFSNIVMTDTQTGINIWLPRCRPELPRLADEGVEATRIENISFDQIIMDSVYTYPIKMLISDDRIPPKCDAIRNIYFRGIRATGLHLPMIRGRAGNVIENVQFNDCTFEVLPFEECRFGRARALPEKYDANDTLDFEIRYVKNLVMNNVSVSIGENRT